MSAYRSPNFHNNKIPREGSQFICLSASVIDFNFRTGKNYYPQVFLEQYKYLVKEKEIPNYIINNIKISSDSDRENSDEGNSNVENFDKENSDEENSDEENSDEENFNEENSDEENFDEENLKIFFIIFFI